MTNAPLNLITAPRRTVWNSAAALSRVRRNSAGLEVLRGGTRWSVGR